jgi:hypothetical protein
LIFEKFTGLILRNGGTSTIILQNQTIQSKENNPNLDKSRDIISTKTFDGIKCPQRSTPNLCTGHPPRILKFQCQPNQPILNIFFRLFSRGDWTGRKETFEKPAKKRPNPASQRRDRSNTPNATESKTLAGGRLLRAPIHSGGRGSAPPPGALLGGQISRGGSQIWGLPLP